MNQPAQFAHDTLTGRIGQIMARRNPPRGEVVDLRPPGGGLEWDAAVHDVKPLADIATQWLRFCNGQPDGGILVGVDDIEAALLLAASGTAGIRPDGTIYWQPADPTAPSGRRFTARPV